MTREACQLLLNGLVAGTILAVPAISVNTIYAVLRFPNFAVASLATVGAFAGYVVNTRFGVPAPAAIAVAFLAAGLVGIAGDEIAVRPIRPSGSMAATIASVALAIALENALRFFFGNEARGYNLPVLRDWHVLGLSLGPQEAEDFAIAVIAMAAVFLFLRVTRTGKAMRAVADNPTLADIKGIDPVLVGRLATGLGMGLAGVGGMLLALDTTVDPLTGFRAIPSILAAAVVGGLGSIPGAVVGALLIGVAEELSLLVLPPDYRTAVGFVAILLVLSLRPRGMLGERAY